MTQRTVQLIQFLPSTQHNMYAAIELSNGRMVASAVIAFGAFTVTMKDELTGTTINTWNEILPVCAVMLDVEGFSPDDYGTPNDNASWSVHSSSLMANAMADEWNAQSRDGS